MPFLRIEIFKRRSVDAIVDKQKLRTARLDRKTIFVKHERRAVELRNVVAPVKNRDERAATPHHSFKMGVDRGVRWRIDKEREIGAEIGPEFLVLVLVLNPIAVAEIGRYGHRSDPLGFAAWTSVANNFISAWSCRELCFPAPRSPRRGRRSARFGSWPAISSPADNWPAGLAACIL